jgi:hypothetical protein
VNTTLESPDAWDTGIALDALATVAAASRNDGESVELMLATYNGDGKDRERGQFLAALIANAVQILKMASEVTGVSPDKVLGGVALSLRQS